MASPASGGASNMSEKADFAFPERKLTVFVEATSGTARLRMKLRRGKLPQAQRRLLAAEDCPQPGAGRRGRACAAHLGARAAVFAWAGGPARVAAEGAAPARPARPSSGPRLLTSRLHPGRRSVQ
jgi:hypothetical protein